MTGRNLFLDEGMQRPRVHQELAARADQGNGRFSKASAPVELFGVEEDLRVDAEESQIGDPIDVDNRRGRQSDDRLRLQFSPFQFHEFSPLARIRQGQTYARVCSKPHTNLSYRSAGGTAGTTCSRAVQRTYLGREFSVTAHTPQYYRNTGATVCQTANTIHAVIKTPQPITNNGFERQGFTASQGAELFEQCDPASDYPAGRSQNDNRNSDVLKEKRVAPFLRHFKFLLGEPASSAGICLGFHRSPKPGVPSTGLDAHRAFPPTVSALRVFQFPEAA